MIEFRPTEAPLMQKTLVTDVYKLVVYANKEYGELYNVITDPDQMNNLWEKEEFQNIKIQLIQKLISADMDKEGTLKTRFAPA